MKVFENVASMKLAHLREGQLVRTKSYLATSEEDLAGSAEYKILLESQFTGTPDETIDHTIANGNIAKRY